MHHDSVNISSVAELSPVYCCLVSSIFRFSLRSLRSVEVCAVVEVPEVNGVRCVQKDKSLRVVSDSFFNNSIQFQQCLVRTDGRMDGETLLPIELSGDS